MKLSEFEIIEINSLIAPEISFENDIIAIKSEKSCYTLAKAVSLTFDIKGNSVYNFNADVSESECQIRYILNCLNEDKKSILRAYLEAGKEIRIPQNAKFAYLEIVVHSFTPFETEIKNISLEYKSEIVKKETVLVAVHIDSDQDVQTTCDENLKKALYGIDKASKVNPDLIVLTECFLNRRTWLPFKETAVNMNSHPVEELKKKAKLYNCYIATSLTIEEEGRYYNRGILINRKGEIEGIYDKTHLTMGERENGFVPGNEVRVFETDFGKVAFAICWDLWFPKLINEYYHKGVRVLINPTAGYPDTQTRARAIDNGMYIVSPTIMSRVRTRIINPIGEVISTAEVNGYAYASVDLDERFEEYWLSVGDTYGEGANIYKNEESRYI